MWMMCLTISKFAIKCESYYWIKKEVFYFIMYILILCDLFPIKVNLHPENLSWWNFRTENQAYEYMSFQQKREKQNAMLSNRVIKLITLCHA